MNKAIYFFNIIKKYRRSNELLPRSKAILREMDFRDFEPTPQMISMIWRAYLDFQREHLETKTKLINIGGDTSNAISPKSSYDDIPYELLKLKNTDTLLDYMMFTAER